MRMVGAGMTAAVLLAGLAASAALAQDTDGDLHSAAPKTKSWWDGWSMGAAKPVDKKPETVVAPAPAAPSVAETAAATRTRERGDLDRRWEVCDRLMTFAVQKDDTAMQMQIEQLRERAWQLYQQRTAHLPTGGPPAPDDKARADDKAPADDNAAPLTQEVKP